MITTFGAYITMNESANGAEFRENVLGSHNGQTDCMLTMRMGGEQVGYVEYSIFEGEVYINFVEVAIQHRRKGYGAALLDRLVLEYGWENIRPGMTTDDGDALYRHMVQKYGEVVRPSRLLSKDVLDRFSDKYPLAGRFVSELVSAGDVDWVGWMKRAEKRGLWWYLDGFELNDLRELSEWVDGSKTAEEGHGEPPVHVSDMVRDVQ